MNIRWMCAPFVLFALSGCGEKGAAPQIEVVGRAKIEKEAEIFRVVVYIHERDKDRLASLLAASKKLENLKKQLGRLEGLTHLKITSDDAESDTIRPIGCDPKHSYSKDYPENCAPLDFHTTIRVTLEGEPAKAAGSATSLLMELGLEKVDLLSYAVKDPGSANLEVRRKALADATITAQTLASQAEMQIGSPVEISYGIKSSGPPPGSLGFLEDRMVVVSAADIAPLVELDLPPDVVTFTADVHVKFAIEESKPEK